MVGWLADGSFVGCLLAVHSWLVHFIVDWLLEF